LGFNLAFKNVILLIENQLFLLIMD
jgi:hypothetical protein